MCNDGVGVGAEALRANMVKEVESLACLIRDCREVHVEDDIVTCFTECFVEGDEQVMMDCRGRYIQGGGGSWGSGSPTLFY